MKRLLVTAIACYQKVLSPALVVLFGHGCRFSPTCSQYAKVAISEEGIGKGLIKTFKRIARCQPYFQI